ncbi:MAG: F0F1 ATP synthase subunit delta [Candidatus Omnitrophota bacterium]
MVIVMVAVQVVTFLAIVFVLRKFLYTESVKEMRRLKVLKEKAATQQKELQEKLDQAQIAFDQKIAEAEKHAQALSAKSEADAKELRQKILDQAKADAEGIMKAVFNAKEKMREEISLEMMGKAPLFAARIFSAVLSGNVKALTHQELVRDVIEKIKHLDPSLFKTRVDHGEILSSYPLSAIDRSEIESAFRQSVGYEVPWVEKKDAKIAVGLVIRLGSIIIDGSLENRMRQAGRELTGERVNG